MESLGIAPETLKQDGLLLVDPVLVPLREAILLELLGEGTLHQKLKEKRFGEIDVDDVVLFFERVLARAQGKLTQEQMAQLMAHLDYTRAYNEYVLLHNNAVRYAEAVQNMLDLPYEVRVKFLGQFHDRWLTCWITTVNITRSIYKRLKRHLPKE